MLHSVSYISLIKRFVLALYVLALILPAGVQAGVQLPPTQEYQLLKDIAESRCLSSGYSGDVAHDQNDCCVLCHTPQFQGGEGDRIFEAVATSFATQSALTEQTTAITRHLAESPPRLRGPPL